MDQDFNLGTQGKNIMHILATELLDVALIPNHYWHMIHRTVHVVNNYNISFGAHVSLAWSTPLPDKGIEVVGNSVSIIIAVMMNIEIL